jgi:hypothetical protein
MDGWMGESVWQWMDADGEKTGQKGADSCQNRLLLGPIWHQNALFLRGIVYSSGNRLVSV